MIKLSPSNRLTQSILRYIDLQGGWATRTNNVGIWDAERGVYRRSNQVRGMPDIMGCCRGHYLGIEVKIGRDRSTLEQQRCQIDIEQAGGLYFVARDFDSFHAWFDEHFPPKPRVLSLAA